MGYGESYRWPAVGSHPQKAQLEAGEGGSRVAAAVQRDVHEKAMTEDRATFERNDPMDVNETKQSSQSEAEKSGAADFMHKRLLEQTEGKIEHEEDIRKIRNSKKKCDRMDEGSKKKKVPGNWRRMI